MDFPQNLKYSETHEWMRVDGNRATIGITDYAQDALGDVVYVELPDGGGEVQAAQTFGVIESVKAAEDLYSPVSGKVIESNNAVIDNPEIVNQSCYQDGWMLTIEMSKPDEVDSLLSAEQYQTKIAQEHH